MTHKEGTVLFLLPLLLLLIIWCPSFSAGQEGPVVSSLSQARFYLASTSVGDLGLFAGGYNATTYCAGVGQPCNESTSNVVDIYNASTGNWSTFALSSVRYLLAATSVGDLALFGGGVNNINSTFSDVVDIYNTSSGEWTTAFLSQARAQLAATSVGGLAFFAGGVVGGAVSAAVDIYNSSSGGWTRTTLTAARANLAAASVGNLAMFAGGDGISGSFTVVDIYNATSGEWTVASLSQARTFLAATTVRDLVLFGGGSNTSTSSVVDIYNATSNTWTNATLSQARGYLSACSIGDLALFAGGMTDSAWSNVVDIYNATSHTWSSATLSQARYGLTAACVDDHVALIAGGSAFATGPSAVVDKFTIPKPVRSPSPTPASSPSISPTATPSPSASRSPSAVPVPSAVVVPQYDPDIPQVDISSPSSRTTSKINIGIMSLEEISSVDQTAVQHIDLRQVLWTVKQSNGSQSDGDSSYIAHLGEETDGSNNATLQLWFNTFDADLTLTTESNYTFTVTPALLKFSINISSWAWKSSGNKLRLTIKVAPKVISAMRWNDTPQDGMTTLLLSGEKGHGVLARILNFGETWSADDGAGQATLRVPVEASVSIANSSLSITFDHFNETILFDPDFGMLIGGDVGNGGGGNNDAVVIGVAVAIPLAILLVVIVIAVMLTIITVQKRRRRKVFQKVMENSRL